MRVTYDGKRQLCIMGKRDIWRIVVKGELRIAGSVGYPRRESVSYVWRESMS